jgi:hypothetical protein
MNTKFVRIADQESWERACKLARGYYQRRLLRGWQSLSGAELRGRGRRWASKYQESRQNLFLRLLRAGILVGEERADHGLRRLVIGDPAVVYQIRGSESNPIVVMDGACA